MNAIDRGARILSWLYLLGFLLLTAVARGVYSSHGVSPSGGFEILSMVGSLTFVWYWLREQCRPFRTSFPIDLAAFLAALWIVLAPYYLWRCQRWGGIAKFGILLAVNGMTYPVSVIVHYALVGPTE